MHITLNILMNVSVCACECECCAISHLDFSHWAAGQPFNACKTLTSEMIVRFELRCIFSDWMHRQWANESDILLKRGHQTYMGLRQIIHENAAPQPMRRWLENYASAKTDLKCAFHNRFGVDFQQKLISRRVQHFICVCKFGREFFFLVAPLLGSITNEIWLCGNYFSQCCSVCAFSDLSQE